MEYLAQGEITTTRKFFSVGDIFCKHGSLIVDFVIIFVFPLYSLSFWWLCFIA
jgi:hypothetical protein